MNFPISQIAIDYYKNVSSKNLDLINRNKEIITFNFELQVNWHDTIINFKIENEDFYLKCCSFFPKNWLNQHLQKTDFTIYIHSDTSLNDSIWEDTNSDCHFFDDSKSKNAFCLQRDFLASKNNNIIHALCKNELSDGFFNLMRWVLPATWVKKNKFLIHSSCILNDNNEAILCLGPSGAGKSTISSFRDKKFILGDDMNLLTIKNYKAYVTPSLLGQRFENQDLYGESYPLKDIYWLIQAEKNNMLYDDQAPTLLYLSQSLVNIFWKNLSNNEMMIIQNLIRFLKSKYTIKQLQFNLNGDIWDYVFKQ